MLTRNTVFQLAVALSMLAVPVGVDADPLDDARALIDDSRPCRAIDVLEDAVSEGYPAPEELLQQARDACSRQRRSRNRREHEAETAAAADRILATARPFSDAGENCRALEALEVDAPEEVTARLSDALESARDACRDDRDAEQARVGTLREQVTSQMGAEGWVLVEAGTYSIGTSDREPEREGDETQLDVQIARAFYIQPREATQGELRDLLSTAPARAGSCGDNCPVENVTWYDAVSYANAFSRAQSAPECYTLDNCRGEPGAGLRCSNVTFIGPTCGGYRLPTEAEWEVAARAGTTDAWWCGSDADCLAQTAWSSENADNQPHPTGALSANPWGLFDVHGNVSEWTHSQYSRELNEIDGDPTEAICSLRCSVRGGAFGAAPQYLRSGNRAYAEPDNRTSQIGFRLVRPIP